MVIKTLDHTKLYSGKTAHGSGPAYIPTAGTKQ